MLSFLRLKVISSLFFVFFTIFCIVIYLFFFHANAQNWFFFDKILLIFGMMANCFCTYLIDREINYDKSNNWTSAWLMLIYQFGLYFFGSQINLDQLYGLLWMNFIIFILLKKENIQPSFYFLLCVGSILVANTQKNWNLIILLCVFLYPVIYKKIQLFLILGFAYFFVMIYVQAYNFIKPENWPSFSWNFIEKEINFSFFSLYTPHIFLFTFVGLIICFGFLISQTKFFIKKDNIHKKSDWLFFLAFLTVVYCFCLQPIHAQLETKIILASFFGIGFNFLNKKLKYPMILDIYLWVFLLSIFILP